MTPPSPSSVLLAEELYRLLGRSRRLLWTVSARSLEARGESPFRWQVVCYLVRNGPTSQKDLAYATAQHAAGVSRLVEDLEAARLVKRAADPKDRRRQLVAATAKGKAWFEKVTPAVMEAVDTALGELGGKDREVLRGLLQKLLGEGG